MTGAGISLYMLYLHNYTLAAITAAAFGPLIIFHFAAERMGRAGTVWQRQGRIKIHSLQERDVSKH